jgi:lysophospholipase L1-like esterase
MRCLLVLCGMLGALPIVEVAVRVFDIPPRPLAQVPFRTYQLSADPIIGYEYRPGYQPDAVPFDHDHIGFAINAAGFRDHDYSVRKPGGTFRSIFVGDSTTAGNGVRDLSKLYVKVLERTLNQLGRRTHYEVMNMAVGGYHTVQEVETLKTKGLAYDPDLVAVTVCQNDFFFDADGGVYSALMRVNARGETDPGVLAGLVKHSRLAFILYHAYVADAVRDQYRSWYFDTVLRGRDPVQAGMAMLKEFQADRHIPVLVVILPDFSRPFSQYASADMHARLRQAVGDAAGVTVVDPLQEFAAIDDDAHRFSNDSLHLNEYGHQALADILLPVLSRYPAGE